MALARLNGLEVAYELKGAGPPLVLAHGGACYSRTWLPQLEALADEMTVVAWDEPGAGRSPDPPLQGLGLTGIADALAGLIEALGLSPAHVGGLSWGGVVALELYRRRPELVGTLILADTYAGWKGSLPASEIDERVADFRRELAAPGEFNATLPGLFARDPEPEVLAAMARVTADVRPASMEQTIGAIAACDLRDVLPGIAVPTLLIWGEEDVRSPPETVARQFHEAIPHSRLVLIPGAGHMSNLERPESFNRAVREFCRAHPL